MTRERQNIDEDFYVGDHKDITDTIYDSNDVLLDLTGGEATFFLFNEDDGGTQLTKSSSDAAEITFNNQVTNKGELVVHFVPGDTLRANPDEDLYGTFRYQIKFVDVSGYGSTVTTGRINIFASPGAFRARDAFLYAYLAGQ
jgi:hypothetical protein